MAGLDAQGVYIYEETDLASPVSDLLNKMGGSVSTQLGDVRNKLVTLDSPLIPAGSNLNNYKTPGSYIQNLSNNATLPLNYPRAIAGLLTVHATAVADFVFQEYRPYFGASYEVYRRGWYWSPNPGAWSVWFRYAAPQAWTLIPAQAGYTSIAEARLEGDLVRCRGSITKTTAPLVRATTVGILPSGMRPGAVKRVSVAIGNTPSPANSVGAMIDTSGNIQITGDATSIGGNFIIWLDGVSFDLGAGL